MLCFPLKNYTNQIIGVAQLINRLGPGGTIIPFDPHMAAIVGPVARVVGTSIERTDMMDQIRHKNKMLQNRNRQLADQRSHIGTSQEQTEEAFLLSVGLLARAAEIHDEGTSNHIVRTNEYSFFIAQHLGMPKEFCDEIHYSALLHDVGKMNVDQAVLKQKRPPGRSGTRRNGPARAIPTDWEALTFRFLGVSCRWPTFMTRSVRNTPTKPVSVIRRQCISF